MVAADLAFYALFARNRQHGEESLHGNDPALSEPFLAEYERITGEMSAEKERAEAALRRGMDEAYFDR